MDITIFFILALATYRLSILIAQESGPLNILDKIRDKIGVLVDMNGNAYGTNNFAIGFVCVFCNSVWVGLMFTVIYLLTDNVYLFLPFALSAVTILFAELFGYG